MGERWEEGAIDGVVVRPLRLWNDGRGWLAEVYRCDELDHQPAMSYISVTRPGQARGPHEHVYQTDHFVFAGPGDFEVWLWDPRETSPTRGRRQKLVGGASNRLTVTVPPRVIHAYRCRGPEDGLVVNLPDKLYAGPGRRLAVDEIRHEEVGRTDYLLD